MIASQNSLEGMTLLSPVSKVKKLRAQYDLLMHDTMILIKKKKYKKTYFSLERFLMTVNQVDFLDGKEKLKMNYRIFYVLDKIIQNKLTKKEVQKAQSIKQIESINARMVEAFMQYNEIYQSILREEQLRNTLESNANFLILVNHEDSISKLYCMTIQLYINNYFVENLKNQQFLAVKYLLEAKEFLQQVYTLNNSHLLEKDIYLSILLGNFYAENGLQNKAIQILQDGIKSVIMFIRYRYTDPNPSLDTEEEEDEKSIWKQRRFQRSIKLIISFLYSFASVYEKMWRIEYAYEALQLARYLGKHVLFDNTDEFKRYLIHVEHELDTKYSKVVQEILEVESIAANELQQNRKWYQMAEVLKEEKRIETEKKNMYDEELYLKQNVRKLNQQKVIMVKKYEEDAFSTFQTTIKLRKKMSQDSVFLNKTTEGKTTTGDRTHNSEKRERATTAMSTQFNEIQYNDSQFFSPETKQQTYKFDDTQQQQQSILMPRISEQRSIVSGGSSDAIFNQQRKRINTHSQSERDTAPPQNNLSTNISYNDRRILSKSINNESSSGTGQTQKNNISFQSNVNNKSSNNLSNVTSVANIYAALNQSKRSDSIKNPPIKNYSDESTDKNNNNNSNYNNNSSSNMKWKEGGQSYDILSKQENSHTEQNKIDIWGVRKDDFQEKAPSNRKKSRSSKSLTHDYSGTQQPNSFRGQIIPNNNYVGSQQKSFQNSDSKRHPTQTDRGDSSTSLYSALKTQNSHSMYRNKSQSIGRQATPNERQSLNNRNTKSGGYNINYGRMSIRIQDIENYENFGALSNLLLNDKLEKLEEDSNTQQDSSNAAFDSPSSSSSTLSPVNRKRESSTQGITESKSFRQKNHMANSSYAPQGAGASSNYSQQHGNLPKGISMSESKSKQYQQSGEGVDGSQPNTSQFEASNFDRQKKDVTNLDYFLSEHIYKALQEQISFKPYTKIKKDISDWRRKDDLQRKNLVFGKKMLKFKMKEDLIRPYLRKLDSSAIKNISSFRQTVNLDAQDQVDSHKQGIQEIKNQLKQKVNETRDSQSQLSDYDEEQNVSMLYDPQNKKESLRDIILKHRSIFPLTRVRKLLKDRKKMMQKKQQQEILKNRYRQSITGNTNNLLQSFVNQRQSENIPSETNISPSKVRFANQYSNVSEDTIKEDDSQTEQQSQFTKQSLKYYLRNKELLHNMIENYETEKERELRGVNAARLREFSSDTARLQKRRSTSALDGGAAQKSKQLQAQSQLFQFHSFYFSF